MLECGIGDAVEKVGGGDAHAENGVASVWTFVAMISRADETSAFLAWRRCFLRSAPFGIPALSLRVARGIDCQN